MKLSNRVAIVTGAAQGIGRAIALELASQGATVVVADINLAGGEDTVKLIQEKDGYGLAVPMDVTSYSQVEQGVSKVLDAYDRIDILANVAGADRKASVWELKEEDWDFIMNLNLKGTWLTCKAVLPAMIERKYGRIVNVASMGGVTGEANTSPYCASKFGVIGFTQSMAFEVGKCGITANCVNPGPTQGPMLDQSVRQGAAEAGMSVEDFSRFMYLDRTPIGRFTLREDVAKAVAFLASDDAAFITGIHLNVSGGREVH